MPRTAYFFNAHRGIWGAGKPLPDPVGRIVDLWEDCSGDPEQLIAEIREVIDAKVEIMEYTRAIKELIPVKDEVDVDGGVRVEYPREGLPRSVWRAIDFRWIGEDDS